MKKILFLLIFTYLLQVNGQEFKTPNAYFNYIGVEKENICGLIWKYNVALAHSKNINQINKLKRTLIDNIKISFDKIALLENGFNGDVEYKNNYLEYLKISEKQINLHFDKVSSLQNYENQTFEELEKYLSERTFINKNIKYQAETLNKNQVDFAKKYGFNFEESKNELSKKMKIAVEVFDNHTAMYMIYLKVYVNQSNLRNAIKNKNVEDINKATKNLEKFAIEGFEKIKFFNAYANDKMLADATSKTLEVAFKEAEYGKFASDYINGYYSFLSKKTEVYQETDEKLKKQKIDTFNKIVTKRNDLIKQFNTLTAQSDSERLAAYDNWNKVGQQFIEKYVPKN